MKYFYRYNSTYYYAICSNNLYNEEAKTNIWLGYPTWTLEFQLAYRIEPDLHGIGKIKVLNLILKKLRKF